MHSLAFLEMNFTNFTSPLPLPSDVMIVVAGVPVSRNYEDCTDNAQREDVYSVQSN